MTDIRFRAPALPYAPKDYDSSSFNQMNNILRLYFNQIDQALRDLAVATPNDFYLEVAKGNVAGHSFIHKFGANFDVDTGSDPETVWTAGGLYPWSSLTTAQTLYVLSTDAGDTGDIVIEGLDANYETQTETLTLTGTTAVTTTNTYLRVYRMYLANGNVGTITARVTSASGTVVAQVDTGKSQTLMAVYTVPAGKTAYITCGDFSVQKGKDAQVQFFQRQFGDNNFRITHMAETFENYYRYDFTIPLPIPEKTDIEVRAGEVEFNNTRVTANFDLLLVDN